MRLLQAFAEIFRACFQYQLEDFALGLTIQGFLGALRRSGRAHLTACKTSIATSNGWCHLGPLLVVDDGGAVEMWGVFGGVYKHDDRRKIALFINLRAPHWQNFFADSHVLHG